MLSENILSFWAEKLGVLAKNYRHGCQNCNLRTFKSFWGKRIFLKLNMIANFFGLRDEENWAFGQKNFLQGFYNRNSRFQRKVLRKNDFSFERGCIFLLSFLEFEWFPCLFLQNSLVRCVKPPINVLREIKWGNYPGKSVFSINFEFWRKKTWFFSKTVRHDSQNRSPPVQLTIFRNFSGSKNICMKVFGHWTETSDFPRKCFLRVVKGAFQVFSATLWEKDDKSKLYILWLV